MIRPTYWSSLTGPIGRQWDEGITGAPLHDGSEALLRGAGIPVVSTGRGRLS